MDGQATIEAGKPARRVAMPPVWLVALVVVITYIVVVTGDAYVLHVPIKLYLVAAAVLTWWAQVGRHRYRSPGYEFGLAVLGFAIAIPVVWSLVAFVQARGFDPAGIHQLTWTLQEASRFVYLLLFFPLLDARRLLGRRGTDVWMGPIVLLCLITIALFLSHYLIGKPQDTIEFLFFKGVFEHNSGGFRIFIGNQVLFIAGLALLAAEVAVRGPNRRRAGLIALIVACAYLSHTRGIWIGLSAVCGGTLVILLVRELDEGPRRLLVWAVGIGVGVVALVGVGMLAGVLPRPGFLQDASAGSRVTQAPRLWDAFKQNPVFGDGLGAVIRPRYVRDPSAPWSYELTYFQLLVQVGVVGLIAVLALPVAAAWRGLKASIGPRFDVEPLAGTMAIVGFLIASATNPYLMSSFGMLAIAIALSLIARVEHRSSKAAATP
jgi:O-antigen ligase